MSNLIDQAEINRAEADVTAAYIRPIIGVPEEPSAIEEKVTGGLAFLLLLQRSIFATRAGAKIKTGYNSQDADAWTKLQQEAHSCHLLLQELRNTEGADANAEVTDICKIYFKTNYFNL